MSEEDIRAPWVRRGSVPVGAAGALVTGSGHYQLTLSASPR